MGEKSDTKLMFSIKEPNEINTLEIDTVESSPLDDFKIGNLDGGEMTFLCNVHPLMLGRIFMDELSLVRYCQATKSNNWLRRHGLPMRRRGGRCL